MTDKIDFFHLQTGKKLSDLPKPPTLEQTVQRRIQEIKSQFPLRLLGRKVTGGDLYISEEERSVNFHIVGNPGEGKSKFIEAQMRKDIDLGNGCCLIDPSDSGDTARKVLNYCALKGHEKVVYISADTLVKYGKIACIQPLQSNYLKRSVAGILEIVNILFGTESKDTPRIKRRLGALLRMLGKRAYTLYETVYFGDYENPKKWAMVGYDPDSQVIRQDFRSQFTWETYFSSTINRLDDFWQPPLSLMLAADTGIDFVRMIREGWVVLVNLYPGLHLSVEQAQLLGVLILSQINQALDILTDDTKSNKWKGRYYVYVDEAGMFATPQIDQILTYKRKKGLHLILAHHDFSQFENRKILNSVKNRTGIKVMFNIGEPKDRKEMMELLGYGGQISPDVASYANKDLPKQYAIIKKNKEDPVRVRIEDTPDIKISQEQLDQYIQSLLQQPWYLTKEEITNQINERIAVPSTSKNPPSPQPRKMDDAKTDSKTAVSGGVSKPVENPVRPDNKKPSDPPPKRPIKI